ncbi:hypothetical protein LVJ78_02040 [Uruburuella suis]|jgi:hypothetical protein|uniref:Uncharacterized protein n=1 Tax=Uruburuella suis TaxID=252130 RepID=A0AAE9KHB8_9NEIS|nr:hypothetical protein [Uruburuella suis]UOO79829.1 hypothetical protein LVJ78_02040 [Uruburuella suis]
MPIQIKHHFLIVKMPSVHIKGRLKTISSRRKMRYDAALITVIFQTALLNSGRLKPFAAHTDSRKHAHHGSNRSLLKRLPSPRFQNSANRFAL